MIKPETLIDRNSVVLFDGAIGTMLQQSGMPKGAGSGIMNIIMPEAVERIHRQYIEAGSDIICTNTFDASAHALRNSGYTPEQIISAGVAIAKRAAEGRALVAFDMGPTGELLEPFGELTYSGAYDMFREQATLAETYGADLVAIETMSDIKELQAAICAVSEHTALPIFATMSFAENGKTYMGATVGELAEVAEQYRVLGVGINCSMPPGKMLKTASALANATKIPLIMKLNAGMPDSDGSYALTAEEYAKQMLPYRDLGVRVVGACCGSGPEFIRALREIF